MKKDSLLLLFLKDELDLLLFIYYYEYLLCILLLLPVVILPYFPLAGGWGPCLLPHDVSMMCLLGADRMRMC